MTTLILCGKLFVDGEVRRQQALTIEDGRITQVSPIEAAPRPLHAQVVDHSEHFVMPGLIDVHVHLSYGEAKTEEDIDLFASLEFRAIRGMEAAQRVLRAGYTSVCDPTTSGRVSLAIRDAVEANLFQGPRLSVSGRNISTRQGLVDWYPTWIGVPDTSIGHVIKGVEDGIDAVRAQVKDGVDFIKFAMDGDAMNPSAARLSCAFRQEEITALVAEAHRLGRKVVVHARGAEGVLYAARAGVDLIFHASFMDDEGLEALVANGCAICPTLNLLVNTLEFTRPTDGCYDTLIPAYERELAAASQALQKAKAAGVRFLVGSEAGFAVTPYGEWHARELENHVKYLGFTPAEALTQATRDNAWFTRHAGEVGVLAAGAFADLIAVRGDPTADVALLQRKDALAAVYKSGEPVSLEPNLKRRRLASEFSYAMWNEVYTRDAVARRPAPLAAE